MASDMNGFARDTTVLSNATVRKTLNANKVSTGRIVLPVGVDKFAKV